MPTVPVVTKSREIGAKTATPPTAFPAKSGDAVEANQ